MHSPWHTQTHTRLTEFFAYFERSFIMCEVAGEFTVRHAKVANVREVSSFLPQESVPRTMLLGTPLRDPSSPYQQSLDSPLKTMKWYLKLTSRVYNSEFK